MEGLRDLIDAETEAQRRIAVSSAEVGVPAPAQYCFMMTSCFNRVLNELVSTL